MKYRNDNSYIYTEETLSGVIDEEYADRYGQGRIVAAQ